MSNDDGDGVRFGDLIEGSSGEELDESIDRAKIATAIRRGLAKLTAREEKILRLRFGISEDPTDHESFPITKSEIIALTARENA